MVPSEFTRTIFFGSVKQIPPQVVLFLNLTGRQISLTLIHFKDYLQWYAIIEPFYHPNLAFAVHIDVVLFRAYNIPFLVNELFVYLLLCGDVKFKFEENQNILKSTLNFITNTSRFAHM